MSSPALLPSASPEHFARIARLAREIWTEHYSPIIGPEQVRHMLDTLQSEEAMLRQAREGLLYFLLVVDDHDVGYHALKPVGNGVWILSKLYIAAPWRGQGLARTILAHIDQTFAPSLLRLWVNRHNHDSIAAYHRLGFRIVRDECTPIGGGFVMDDHVMERVRPA